MTESKSKGLWLMLISAVVVAGMGVAYFVMEQQPERIVGEINTPEVSAGSEVESSVIQILQLPESSEVDEVPMTQKVAAGVKWFGESTLGRSKYAEKVKTLSSVNDEVSARLLMALTEDPKSSIAALEALGDVHNPSMKKEIIDHLRKQSRVRRMDVQKAALESFARIGGDEVLPEMENYIVSNWRRPDGWGEQVCTAIIKGVAEIGTQASLEMLGRQLQRVQEKDWLPDYGTVVVWAISKYNHPRIKAALLQYAEGLSYRLKTVPNTAGQNYLKEKIKQATDAAASLDRRPQVGTKIDPHFGHNH